MKKEIFDLQERHESTILNTSKTFFSNNHVMDIFMFVSTIISLTSTTLTTGGSHLSRTAVKPNSCLARIFVAKFLCIIKLIIIIG